MIQDSKAAYIYSVGITGLKLGKHTPKNHRGEVREGVKPSGDSALNGSRRNRHMLKVVKAKENHEAAKQPQQRVSNSATPTTLCGHFLKCSITEECKKYPTGPVLLISDHSTPELTVCANPPCLSDYGTRESYVTADSYSPFIPTSPSQEALVTFPETRDRKSFPTPSR